MILLWSVVKYENYLLGGGRGGGVGGGKRDGRRRDNSVSVAGYQSLAEMFDFIVL